MLVPMNSRSRLSTCGRVFPLAPPLSLGGHAVNWESKIPFYYIAAALTVFAWTS
jgi:hypothetical protein